MTQHSDAGAGLSILDLLEERDTADHAAVLGKALEDIRALHNGVRASMDAGLTPEEMTKARAVAEGALSAEAILNKLLA